MERFNTRWTPRGQGPRSVTGRASAGRRCVRYAPAPQRSPFGSSVIHEGCAYVTTDRAVCSSASGFRAGSPGNLFAGNVVTDCGLVGFSGNKVNGEGIYIGIVGNSSTGHLGAGILQAGDRPTDGTGSVVMDNDLSFNQGYGLKAVAAPQGVLCGNNLIGNRRAPATPVGAGADRPC